MTSPNPGVTVGRPSAARPGGASPAHGDLDWLVVGGGLHGAHVAACLVAAGRGARLRVLDPHAAPLAVWDARAAAVGMDVMRSSGVHHLAPEPYDLLRFAETPDGKPVARFERPYGRPGLDLFRAHAARTLRDAGLADADGGPGERWLRGAAERLEPAPGGWRVETDRGAVRARRVVLALGPPPPHVPAWAAALRAGGADVRHLFEAGFRRADVPDGAPVAVVGGGISAVQTALALARRGPTTLVMRHAPRIHDLDADPGWLGPKRMADFDALGCPQTRRAAIAAARHRGSVPPGVWAQARRAESRGRLAVVCASVEAARVRPGGVHLALRTLAGEARALDVQAVVLATGFEAARPGGALVDAAAEALGLPTEPCGTPRLTDGLAWAPGLFATAGLAELRLGPVARNLHGARQAAPRLLAQT